MKTTQIRPVLELALAHALNHLESLDQAAVAATMTLSELRSRLAKPLNDSSIEPVQVIKELVADAVGGIHGSAGGRFFGWVIGGSLPAALAADWLASTWDQNAASYATGPAVSVIEEIAGEWLKEILQLPAQASFAFVTGSQMGHATALAAARNALLAKHDWNVERKGLMGAPLIRILSSNQRHGSIDRAVRLLGLGSDSVDDLPIDEQGRLQKTTLEKELMSRPNMPTIVLLQAGDLNIGAFDSFAELIPLAHEYQAWVHVDGAFGLWAAASPKYQHLLAGVEHADSWTTDGHKWLNLPFDCGYVFIVDPEPHRNSMAYVASYTVRTAGARDQAQWNPEWSRRGRGVATYAALRQLGRAGVANLVERTCQYAHTLVTHIGGLPGVQIVWEPQVNQGLLRFLSSKSHATEADHDQRTEEVIAAILNTGEAFFTGTTWRGKRCMRVSVCNWQTDANDVERAVSAVKQILELN